MPAKSKAKAKPAAQKGRNRNGNTKEKFANILMPFAETQNLLKYLCHQKVLSVPPPIAMQYLNSTPSLPMKGNQQSSTKQYSKMFLFCFVF